MISIKNFSFLYLLSFFMCIAAVKQPPSTEDVFTNIYVNKIWGANQAGEGHSGCGSTLSATESYRYFLQNFFKAFDIHSVVDFGCGDWEFSRELDWDGIDYLGLDVVKHVIKHDQEQFSTEHIRFVHVDGLTAELPQADLLICKDVLQHLTNGDVKLFLKQLPSFKYCLITNDVDPQTQTTKNSNSPRGGYRWLDLTQPPYNVIGEKIFSYTDGHHLKQVLLIVNDYPAE